jgi:sugar O-acyltransferase (sialic acid O-acetyltransferase NeuD family)
MVTDSFRMTVGFGAGGHARVVLDVLTACTDRRVVGLLDNDSRLHGELCFGVRVLGADDLLASVIAQGVTDFFLGVGSVGSTERRQRLYTFGLSNGLVPVSTLHPSAIVSPRAVLGPGVTVLAGAVINACATLGANVLINTAAVVEHDCVVRDHVHVASGAVLLGGVRVDAGAHVGGGATVRQGVTIGAGAIVGAGAVVVADVPPGETVVGVPARPLGPRRST